MHLSRTRLHGLSRKYRVLSALRRGALAPKEALRPLAHEFPGALRELDCLPMAELEARLHAVAAAERGEVPQPWIAWMLAYHERMRLALEAKQRLRGARASDAVSAPPDQKVCHKLGCSDPRVLRWFRVMLHERRAQSRYGRSVQD